MAVRTVSKLVASAGLSSVSVKKAWGLTSLNLAAEPDQDAYLASPSQEIVATARLISADLTARGPARHRRGWRLKLMWELAFRSHL